MPVWSIMPTWLAILLACSYLSHAVQLEVDGNGPMRRETHDHGERTSLASMVNIPAGVLQDHIHKSIPNIIPDGQGSEPANANEEINFISKSQLSSTWRPILEFKVNYKPDRNAIGTVKGTPGNGPAKLSDADINAIPADSQGYYHYKITANEFTTGWLFKTYHGQCQMPIYTKCKQNTLFVRTRKAYVDTDVAFGWVGAFDLCFDADKETCDRNSSWLRATGNSFDTFYLQGGNTCARWFADNGGVITCVSTVDSGKRCFSTGQECDHVARVGIVMYKLSGGR